MTLLQEFRRVVVDFVKVELLCDRQLSGPFDKFLMRYSCIALARVDLNVSYLVLFGGLFYVPRAERFPNETEMLDHCLEPKRRRRLKLSFESCWGCLNRLP